MQALVSQITFTADEEGEMQSKPHRQQTIAIKIGSRCRERDFSLCKFQSHA
jgi:hypothetical protein